MQFKKIEDFCSELEMHVREQEKYTSKDFLVVDNPPFDPNVDDDALLELIVFFIKKFLRYELEPSKIKACHILPGRAEEKGLMASVIVKFLYFRDKNQIYANQMYLRGQKKRNKSKNIHVRERLPGMDAYIKKLAEGKGLITSTNNCTVSVLCDQVDGRKKLVEVNDVTELDNVKNLIVREQNRRPDQIFGFNKPKRPLQLTDDEPADRLFAALSPNKRKLSSKLEGQLKCWKKFELRITH